MIASLQKDLVAATAAATAAEQSLAQEAETNRAEQSQSRLLLLGQRTRLEEMQAAAAAAAAAEAAEAAEAAATNLTGERGRVAAAVCHPGLDFSTPYKKPQAIRS